MAQDLLSSFLSKSALTISEVNPGQSPIARAKNLKVKRASIRLSSRLMRHMQEDGTTVVDCRIILPQTISLDVFCPTLDDLSQVTTIMLDRVATYDIKSRGVQLGTMMLDNEVISQTPEVLSAAPVKLNFKELLIQGSQKPVREQTGDSSVVDRGLAALKNVSDSAKEAFNNAIERARNVANTAIDSLSKFGGGGG